MASFVIAGGKFKCKLRGSRRSRAGWRVNERFSDFCWDQALFSSPVCTWHRNIRSHLCVKAVTALFFTVHCQTFFIFERLFFHVSVFRMLRTISVAKAPKWESGPYTRAVDN